MSIVVLSVHEMKNFSKVTDKQGVADVLFRIMEQGYKVRYCKDCSTPYCLGMRVYILINGVFHPCDIKQHEDVYDECIDISLYHNKCVDDPYRFLRGMFTMNGYTYQLHVDEHISFVPYPAIVIRKPIKLNDINSFNMLDITKYLKIYDIWEDLNIRLQRNQLRAYEPDFIIETINEVTHIKLNYETLIF